MLANMNRYCWISFCVESNVVDRVSVLHAIVKLGNLLFDTINRNINLLQKNDTT